MRGIKISKRLLTSAVVGAFLILGTVLIVSLIGGNDKPDITNDPPDDEQLPDDNTDTQPDDSTPADDSQDTSDDGADDKTSDDETPDGDQDDDPDETHQGKGQQNGNCHRHNEKHAGLVTGNAEHNALEHDVDDAVEADFGSDDAGNGSEDDESKGESEGGNGQGACNCGDDDKGEKSGQRAE